VLHQVYKIGFVLTRQCLKNVAKKFFCRLVRSSTQSCGWFSSTFFTNWVKWLFSNSFYSSAHNWCHLSAHGRVQTLEFLTARVPWEQFFLCSQTADHLLRVCVGVGLILILCVKWILSYVWRGLLANEPGCFASKFEHSSRSIKNSCRMWKLDLLAYTRLTEVNGKKAEEDRGCHMQIKRRSSPLYDVHCPRIFCINFPSIAYRFVEIS
jgi:hypothetical protein